MERTRVNAKEVRRGEVLSRVKRGELYLAEAAGVSWRPPCGDAAILGKSLERLLKVRFAQLASRALQTSEKFPRWLSSKMNVQASLDQTQAFCQWLGWQQDVPPLPGAEAQTPRGRQELLQCEITH